MTGIFRFEHFNCNDLNIAKWENCSFKNICLTVFTKINAALKLIIIKMLFIKFETFIFPENKGCFARQYLYRKTPDTW